MVPVRVTVRLHVIESCSLVAIGAEAGVSVQLIQALGSVLTAVLRAVVVVQAAVVAHITRRTHTPAIQQDTSVQQHGDKAVCLSG